MTKMHASALSVCVDVGAGDRLAEFRTVSRVDLCLRAAFMLPLAKDW